MNQQIAHNPTQFGIYASCPPPALAPGFDDVVTLYGDIWASYGPREEADLTDGRQDVACEPKDAEVWSVYVYTHAVWGRWEWIADAKDRETARMIAAAYMLQIRPSRMRGE